MVCVNPLKAISTILLILTVIVGCTSPPPSSTTSTVVVAPPTILSTATTTLTPEPTATTVPTATSSPIPTATTTPSLISEITISETSLTTQVSPPGNSVIRKEQETTSDDLDPSECAQVTDEGLCILFVELYFSTSGQLMEAVQTTNGEETAIDPSVWFQMSDRQAFVPLRLKFDHDYEITFLIEDTNEGTTGAASVLYSVR